MKKSSLLTACSRRLVLRCVLSCATILALGAASARAQEAAPAPVAPVLQGVHVPITEPSALRPGDIAPAFALPDMAGNLISSRSWLTQRSLLVLSLAAPAAQDAEGVAAQAAGAAPSAEQVLAARRISEAVKGAAPRLQRRGVVIVVIAGGPYFAALKQAMGAGFAPSTVPEVLEPDAPNLFVLRDDASADAPTDATARAEETAAARPELATRRVPWSELMGRTDSGVALTGIDIAGFVRLNEQVSDLLNLEALLSLTGDVSPKLEIGRAAPDFSARDDHGRARRLSDLRGRKNLLLTFFPKCFTGGCANHLSSLGAERLAFQSINTEIWAVSFDPAEGERGQLAFARQLNLSFPLIPDVNKNLSMLYESALSPDQPAPGRMTILIDRDGMVRFVDRAVQVRSHGPDMLLKMRELGMK